MHQIISTVKFRMIRVGHVAWLGQIRSTEFRSESPKERDNLRDLDVDGRIIDNNWTQMVCEVVDGISVRQNAEKWCTVLKNIRDLQVPSKKENFFTKGAIIGFSKIHLDRRIDLCKIAYSTATYIRLL
jgi:hypothetical protein